MNIVVEKQPKCVATLRVEIPAEKVTSERTKIVRNYINKSRLPGFRPGKAPQAVVEKRYGKDISDELQENLINEAYEEAIKQESLKVLDFGVPQLVTTHPDGAFSFEATLTLAPEVLLPEYKGITVIVPPAAVPDEDLNQQLESLRERFAEFTPIEDRAAEMGDFAVIDYTSTINGQPTDEFLGKPAGYLSGREGFWVRLDDKSFLPGFASQVAGMPPGESRDIPVTLPADFPVADLCNAEMVFATTLKELKQSILPDLNDELAERLAPGKTLDEITTLIRDNMQHERQRKIDDLKVNQIVEHFNALVDFELPDELITQETQSQADAMVERGISAGMTEQEVQSQQGEIFASAQHQAVSNLRTNFILQEIARVETIAVDDKELLNHLFQIANSRKVAPKKFIKDMQRAGRIGSIRQSMLIGKTVDFLVEHAKVEENSEASLND
ncbi:MAG: trigger factor [Verrucomicrobiota bacterium]